MTITSLQEMEKDCSCLAQKSYNLKGKGEKVILKMIKHHNTETPLGEGGGEGRGGK